MFFCLCKLTFCDYLLLVFALYFFYVHYYWTSVQLKYA